MKRNPDSIRELLNAIGRCSKRRKLKYVGVRVTLYGDGSGYINDQFDNRDDFGTIEECLALLRK